MLTVFDYPKSTACYRIRIALNLKGVAYQPEMVNLFTGEQMDARYLAINPQGLVPALQTEDGLLAQSMAIMEWLDETYPERPLVHGSAYEKAQQRSLAYAIICDIHPLNNLRVLKYLTGDLALTEEQKIQWYHHWLKEGFDKIERSLSGGDTCFDGGLSIADVCLIPQVFNAHRFGFSMQNYPKINAIEAHCLTLPEFQQAKPPSE